MADYVLNDSPEDCISSLSFHPTNPEVLLATSWDKTGRVYDVGANVMMKASRLSKGALLSGCFSSTGEHAFMGGLDWGNEYSIGEHKEAISSLAFNLSTNLLLSGSWDKTIGVWDHQAPSPLVEKLQLENNEKVYAISTASTLLAVSTSNRQILVYDLRNRSVPLISKQSMLKFPTRTIELFPNAAGIIYTSIEGRVAVENFDKPELNYAFKCHRKPNSLVPSNDNDGENEVVDLVYSVNATCFHPIYNTFVTGGSDGGVNCWDFVNKKRLKVFGSWNNGISALSYNKNGDLLAIGNSYTFDQGDKP
ncbi:Mitotic checkpoint protein [Smittium culicis]|uniref:Mitotic checkpoint protein n=1 Tax=Smittium culicis TaxID=133412 RepID=A0A1R1Y4D2_9FUNG|nr:Mitotic checkpoint protein [Smittium culicis]